MVLREIQQGVSRGKDDHAAPCSVECNKRTELLPAAALVRWAAPSRRRRLVRARPIVASCERGGIVGRSSARLRQTAAAGAG